MRLQLYIKTVLIHAGFFFNKPLKVLSDLFEQSSTKMSCGNGSGCATTDANDYCRYSKINASMFASGGNYKSYLIGAGIYFWTFIMLIALNLLTSCKKFIEVESPVTQILSSDVFSSDASAMAAGTSIYAKMASLSTYNYSLYLGYSADEFKNYSASASDIQFYTNGLLATNGVVSTIWSDSYRYIYQANAIIEGANSSATLSPAIKTQLIGEAKFTRAFHYFYLATIFNDVPLITTSDYTINALAGRTASNLVLEQVVDDLKDAQNKLNVNFVAADGITKTTERLRPTKAAATALLARIYLYTSDWDNAILQASSIISSGAFALGTDLTKVFAKNSQEAIWQLSAGPTFNTNEGFTFIATSTPQYVTLSNSLLGSFEANDKRRTNWVGSVTVGANTYLFPYKYRVQYAQTVSEYVMVLRYAEQFLIRSEAYARKNKLSEAIADLNTIRGRAGLSALPSTLTFNQILSAIEQERNVELFSEWGDRWLNLKRTGRLNAVMTVASTVKGGTWNANAQFYPIPQADRSLDPNLSQNDGY